MTNEYMFVSDKHRDTIDNYKPVPIKVDISTIENTNIWIVAFSLPNMNENNAMKLSDVHDYVTRLSPFVLSCESSEYYNQRLFPFVNQFERKLRKLLYLATAVSGDEKATNCVNNLESKDFGQIFSDWFIDIDFINKTKIRINAKDNFKDKDKFSKAEIQAFIEDLTESTLWDLTLGSIAAPTLRSNFREIHNYRNDVMHAHNTLGSEQFRSAYSLFTTVNKELDNEITSFTAKAKKMTVEEKQEVSRIISSTIEAMDLYTPLSEALNSNELLSTSIPYTQKRIRGLDQDDIKAMIDRAKIPSSSSISDLLENNKLTVKSIMEAMKNNTSESLNESHIIINDAKLKESKLLNESLNFKTKLTQPKEDSINE